MNIIKLDTMVKTKWGFRLFSTSGNQISIDFDTINEPLTREEWIQELNLFNFDDESKQRIIQRLEIFDSVFKQ